MRAVFYGAKARLDTQNNLTNMNSPQDNIAPKLLPQILWRQKQLFHAQEDKFKDQNVVEIAPGHGLFSQAILQHAPKHLTLVEHDPHQSELLAHYFAADARVSVSTEDVHHALTEKLAPVDTIVCAGFLYHTPHPLWVLERMAALNPRYILIDTACSQNGTIYACVEPTNQHGYRQTNKPHAGVAIKLPPEVYLTCMNSLGYRPVEQLNTVSPPTEGLPPDATDILKGWQRCFSFWFVRK